MANSVQLMIPLVANTTVYSDGVGIDNAEKLSIYGCLVNPTSGTALSDLTVYVMMAANTTYARWTNYISGSDFQPSSEVTAKGFIESCSVPTALDTTQNYLSALSDTSPHGNATIVPGIADMIRFSVTSNMDGLLCLTVSRKS